MKKLVLLLALQMVLCIGAAQAKEVTAPVTSGDYKYTREGVGVAHIREYINNSGDGKITIPSKLDGYPVVKIAGGSFKKYGVYIFTIDMPDSILYIDDKAFSGCTNLKRITLSNNLKELGKEAFTECKNLEEITIPEGIERIEEGTFYNCNELKKIIIPDSVTSIGKDAFEGCNKLTEIQVSLEHPRYATINGVLFDKVEKKLIYYPSAFTDESYAIPEGIVSIGEYAFSKCVSLKEVMIPDSVTEIGEGAFNSCLNLTDIAIPEGVTEIRDLTFNYCQKLLEVVVPDGLTKIGNRAFSMCVALPEIEIPERLREIGIQAFWGCGALKEMIIPATTIEIGESAFERCKNLTLTVQQDSYAAAYAKENGLNYTYPDLYDWLDS